jgi:hypothetical protein
MPRCPEKYRKQLSRLTTKRKKRNNSKLLLYNDIRRSPAIPGIFLYKNKHSMNTVGIKD